MSWFSHRVLEFLFLPPSSPLLVLVLGLILLRWRPRLGRIVICCGVLFSLFFILPTTVGWLIDPLESVAAPLDLKQAQGAEAILILGGGRYGDAPEYGGPTVNHITLERLRYGARLARTSKLPVMVSGGVGAGRESEAWLMADTLKQDFKVTPLWLEDRSATTAENAINSAAILRKAGIKHVILVTHAAHMRRALNYFVATGLTVTPAPTSFFGPMTDSENSFSYLPSASSTYAGWYAAHEWAGLLQQHFSK